LKILLGDGMQKISMQIRPARLEDADEICAVVRNSIIELCGADHRGDATILKGWLANKTPDNVRDWIVDDNARLLVAVESGRICGAASADRQGEVRLNYVSPHAQYRGASNALLIALETWLREIGVRHVKLTSTKTAYRFYLHRGYRDNGALKPCEGQLAQGMVKDI
jgi:GNAT superfamily N-acetyltransferase